jgi:hypothetical protein
VTLKASGRHFNLTANTTSLQAIGMAFTGGSVSAAMDGRNNCFSGEGVLNTDGKFPSSQTYSWLTITQYAHVQYRSFCVHGII